MTDSGHRPEAYGHPIPAHSGPPHPDPSQLAGFGGTLRPRRGQLLATLLPLAGVIVLIVFMHMAGWGIVMTVALGIMVVFAGIVFALSWWRVRFEVRGQEVHYYPALARMRRLVPADVAEVVHLNVRSPGSKATEWVTVLAGPGGQRLLSLSTPTWPPASLQPVLAPLVDAGARLTVIEEPLRVSELRPRYADMLPWARRYTGALIALGVVAVVALVAISVLVG